MDKLKKERSPMRRAITVMLKEIEEELAKDEPDREDLDDYSEQLRDLFEQVAGINVKILQLLAENDVADDVYDLEYNGIQEYRKKMIRAKTKIQRFLERPPVVQPPSPVAPQVPPVVDVDDSISLSGDKKKSFRLPKLELKKFNGQLTEWIAFWSQFEKIHEDEDLHDTDKFQYLLQAMEPNSRPMDVVSSYPPSTDNYPKAVKALKERFGNDDMLVEVYVRELLKLVVMNSNSPHGRPRVSSFFDRVESHIRALETLGVTTDRYASMLFPLVESSLPEDTLRAWQRSSYAVEVLKDGKTRLSLLIDFLRREVEAEERIRLAKSGFGLPIEKKISTRLPGIKSEVPTAAGLHSSVASKCIFCDRQHDSRECGKAQEMSLAERKSKLESNRACFSCLKTGHTSKKCRSYSKCLSCGRKHHVLLCNDFDKQKNTRSSSNQLSTTGPSDCAVSGSMSATTCSGEVVLQTLLVTVCGNRKNRVVRALVDTGSQRSYLLQTTADELGIQSNSKEELVHALFGGHQTKKTIHNLHLVELRRPNGGDSVQLELLSQNKICSNIPRMSRNQVPWNTLRMHGIQLSDVGNGTPTIEVLFGADACGRIFTGTGHQLGEGLVALETVLGWTAMGTLNSSSAITEANLATQVVSMTVQEMNIESLWLLETIGIRDPAEVKSKKDLDDEAKKAFLNFVRLGDGGRYSVRLPWVTDDFHIPSNFEVAIKRLESAVKKLDSEKKYEVYEKIFQDWLKEGFIEQVPLHCEERCHYLPHRPVFKPQSLTTPVRPVFDASCRTLGNLSLNDVLHKGPNLLEMIPDILIRFRIGKIGFTSDIRKAFQMIDLESEDRDMLRFLWYSTDRKSFVVYRHTRVVFGITSSPFLLGATIQYHLGKLSSEDQPLAQKLLESLYVDNCVSSVDTMDEYLDFKIRSTSILKEANMELRLWEETVGETPGVGLPTDRRCGLGVSGRHPHQDSRVPASNVLGMKWDRVRDTLFCVIEAGQQAVEITKRVVTSALAKIYDPLGILCPAVLPAKRIVQTSWEQKCNWDEQLPEEQRHQFEQWNSQVDSLRQVEIPRRFITELSTGKLSLHVFCDASNLAYAAVIFLRSEGSEVTVQLVLAKSRLSPVKKTTIPRLELLGCLLGTRLARSVTAAMRFSGPVYFWSDSTTAVQWIRRTEQWGVFVNNRVKEIRQFVQERSEVSPASAEWRHVPGVLNPADLPSRGCSPSQLAASRWWEGPTWLKREEDLWPREAEDLDEEAISIEKKKVSNSTTLLDKTVAVVQPWGVFKFSSHLSCIRVMGWIRRFINQCRKQKNFAVDLTAEEVNYAEVSIFRSVQNAYFPDSLIEVRGVQVIRDKDGLLRVKTKLLQKEDTMGFRLPILLPNNSEVVERLIRWEHENCGHAGVQITMTKLRERVWILGGRKTVKKLIGKCVTCRRFAAKSFGTIPAALPIPRVTEGHAFLTTGIDLAGPLFLKDGTKAWIIIFTCAVYRCCHLELVTSQSTEAFILALWKFINRRGRPHIIYSDNGRNFLGANNGFAQLDWTRIKRDTRCHRINWRFNPPAAPWWGGFWERLIRIVKDLLKRMLGNRKLNFHELDSCVVEVEGIMNDRPLTYLSDDLNDLIPLTPSLFLKALPTVDVPEVEQLPAAELRGRVKSLNQLREELKGRFRKEYLSTLVHRGKSNVPREWKAGEVVLIGEDNKKRLLWNMGRILELLPSRDASVRVVRLQTANGTLVRPIQRIFPLEVFDSEELEHAIPEVQENSQDKPQDVLKTKSGRIIRKPDRLSYFNACVF